METVNLTLDQDEIRFTPEGKIAVVDAIEALTGAHDGTSVWENMVDGHPELHAWYDTYHFPTSEATPVVGSQGWEKVEALLFDYIVAMEIQSTLKRQQRHRRARHATARGA